MIELLSVEQMALTIGLAQILRGEEPLPNTATMCILALARLAGKHDWTKDGRTAEEQFR